MKCPKIKVFNVCTHIWNFILKFSILGRLEKILLDVPNAEHMSWSTSVPAIFGVIECIFL